MCGPDAPEIIQVRAILWPFVFGSLLSHSSFLVSSYDRASTWSRALLLHLNAEPPKQTLTARYVCLKRNLAVKQLLISSAWWCLCWLSGWNSPFGCWRVCNHEDLDQAC
jgi:hypothetical protein